MEILILVLILAAFGAITGMVAVARDHKFWPFFFIGSLLSPILGIALAFILQPKRAVRRRRRGSTATRGGNGRTRPSSARRLARNLDNPYAAPRR